MLAKHFILLPLTFVLAVGEDAPADTRLRRRDGTDQESDFEYEGADGLCRQMTDVHRTAVNQISTAAANIGVAVGGLAANVATQGLRKTYDVIDGGRQMVVDNLERVQECGTRGLELVEQAVTGTTAFISRKLEALVNLLEGVARTVTMRRKLRTSSTAGNATPG